MCAPLASEGENDNHTLTPHIIFWRRVIRITAALLRCIPDGHRLLAPQKQDRQPRACRRAWANIPFRRPSNRQPYPRRLRGYWCQTPHYILPPTSRRDDNDAVIIGFCGAVIFIVKLVFYLPDNALQNIFNGDNADRQFIFINGDTK